MDERIPRLEWSDSSGITRMLPLTEPRATIGRRATSTVVVDHPLTSRHHAELLLEDAIWFIADLDSTHGTWVNGSRITRHPLTSGDRIGLGIQGAEILFLHQQASPGLLNSEDLDLSIRRLAAPAAHEGALSEFEKITRLLDLHYSFGKTFSAEKTFHDIAGLALRVSGAERGFILRKQDESFVYTVGIDGSGRTLPQADFNASQSAVAHVTRTGEPVFMTQGLHGELAEQQSIVAMNLQAIACLPLESMSREGTATVMGILYLDSRKLMHSLSGLDEKLLGRLAGEAGHVLEKLELVEALEERRRVERELAIAEETQRALLPGSLPDFAPYTVQSFYRATRHLGGDFYDFLRLANGHLVGALADVSGKGIPASLLASLTIGALNAEFRASPDPQQAAQGLSHMLHRKSQGNRFVTMFLFVLDAHGNGTYIGAGHNPSFIYRADTGDITRLTSTDLPLGIFPDVPYHAVPFTLHPGDTLVTYSDGLTEAENIAAAEFGETRLEALIQRHAAGGSKLLCQALLTALDDFTKGAVQNDDITFVLVENPASHAIS